MRGQLERGITDRTRVERIDLGREVAITTNRLREIEGADDGSGVPGFHVPRFWFGVRSVRGSGFGRRTKRRQQLARLGVERVWVCLKLFVQLQDVGPVDALEVGPVHD